MRARVSARARAKVRVRARARARTRARARARAGVRVRVRVRVRGGRIAPVEESLQDFFRHTATAARAALRDRQSEAFHRLAELCERDLAALVRVELLEGLLHLGVITG